MADKRRRRLKKRKLKEHKQKRVNASQQNGLLDMYMQKQLGDCAPILEKAVGNAVDYLEVALGAPTVYCNFMMEQKVWASMAPNPNNEPLPKLDPIFNGVLYDVESCREHLHKSDLYTGLNRFYQPGACLENASECLHRRGIDLTSLYKATAVSECLRKRPLGNDPLEQINADRYEMEIDANKAYQKAERSEGPQRYAAARRWIYSLLASRIGLPVIYKSPDVSFFPEGGSIGQWVLLPGVSFADLGCFSHNKLLRVLYWVSAAILRAEVSSVSVPQNGFDLANKDILLDPDPMWQLSATDFRPSHAGLIELYRSILNVWKLKDDQRLAKLLDSKFANYWWDEVSLEREGRINWCIGQWAADVFGISPPPTDLHPLVVKEMSQLESTEDRIEEARLLRGLFTLVTGDTPPLPNWVNNLDEELRGRLQNELEGDLDKLSMLTIANPGFVKSFEASGHQALVHFPWPSWYERLGETAKQHLEAGEYDFISYIKGPVDCVRLSGVNRPNDCRTAYMHYCRAIEAVAWDRVFCPAIQKVAITFDSKVIQSWRENPTGALSVVKSSIRKAESAMRIAMVRSVDGKLSRKDLTLGAMGFVVREMFNQAELSARDIPNDHLQTDKEVWESDNILFGSAPAVTAFFKSDIGHNFFLSMETGSRGAIEQFASKYRNLEAHPNQIVTWDEALLGRRFSRDLLQWFYESCPPPEFFEVDEEDMAIYFAVKQQTPIPYVYIDWKRLPCFLLDGCLE